MITAITRLMSSLLLSALVITFWGLSPAAAAPALQWAQDGAPVVTAIKDQLNLRVATDGHDGTIIVWQDQRSGSFDLYAQRLDADGQRLWGADGVRVTTLSSVKFTPAILEDGHGGAFVVWEDRRNGTGDIYAQHLNSAGQPVWHADGLPLAVVVRDQIQPAMVSDGQGGFIAAWTDKRRIIAYYNEFDIFAQRVSAEGQTLWSNNGAPVSIAPGLQTAPQLLADGQGGAFVAYIDDRTTYYGSATSQDIFAQHINSAGQLLWNANGAAVCNATGYQGGHALISDGADGVVLAWWDRRGLSSNIYAQRLTASGQSLWAGNGIPISPVVGDQSAPQLATDGADGVIIVWEDARKGNWALGDSARDIYAQRINTAGHILWAPDGLPITLAVNSQVSPSVTSDGHGGAIITWYSYVASSNTDIFAQRIDRDGHLLWGSNEIPVSQAAYFQYSPSLLGNGDGGAIVVWTDRRTGLAPAGDYDIYAQRISDVPVNRAPEFDPLAPMSMQEGSELDVTVAARDPDDDPLLLSATNLPAFAVFTDHGDGSGTLSLHPGYDAAGLYPIEFTADDGHGGTATLPAQLTVVNVNRPPAFVGLTDQQLAECATLNLPIAAVDPDGDAVTSLTANQLPAGMTLVHQTLSWTPTAHQAGVYTILLSASDGQLTATAQLVITVLQTPYGFSGFLPPLSATKENIAKLGSTVPVNFRLSSCGPDPTAQATVWVQRFVDGVPVGSRQPAQSTDKATIGNTVRNTNVSQLFHYNLNTSGLSKGAWQIQVDLDDGTTHAVMLRLK